MSGSEPQGDRVIAECVISIIMPVYGVETYLRECLDSVLTQAGDAVEIVAVNDASPDGCGEVLAQYAAHDHRLRVVTHPTNLGVSAARNTGLDHARGAYVWFVDPDDWLTPGATDVVVDRIRRHHPDVIVVGYERSYADGRRFSDRLVAPGPALPEVFTAHEQPRILTTLTLACNKVIRREYLTGLGLRWGAGWYEDVAYTKPLLLAAERIGLIEAVCYGYRQRPEGATTSTTSQRHTEVFQQWQHVFDFADRPEYRDLRPVMFQRMIVHYLGILNHPSRIARAHRRAFFGRIVDDYRRRRPAGGYPRPGGVANVTFTLVAANAFGLFEALRAVYRTRTGVRQAARAVRHGLGRAYYRVQRWLPLRPVTAIFAAGAHGGYPASPYTRSVAEVIDLAGPLAAGTETVVVLGDRQATGAPGRSCPVGSWAAYRVFARARLLISDGEPPPGMVVRPGQRVEVLAPTSHAALPAPREPAAAGPIATSSVPPDTTAPGAIPPTSIPPTSIPASGIGALPASPQPADHAG